MIINKRIKKGPVCLTALVFLGFSSYMFSQVATEEGSVLFPADVKESGGELPAGVRDGSIYSSIDFSNRILAKGLDVPDDIAVGFLLLSAEGYLGEFINSDRDLLLSAKLDIESLRASEVRHLGDNVCRQIIDNATSSEAPAIAEFIVLTKAETANSILSLYETLLSKLSPDGVDQLERKKEAIHSRLSMNEMDWISLSQNDPDALIEKWQDPCSKR